MEKLNKMILINKVKIKKYLIIINNKIKNNKNKIKNRKNKMEKCIIKKNKKYKK